MCSTRWPGVFVIGLTGGIASGKSTVSEMLSELGAVIIDADLLSREVTLPGSEGLEEIRKAFGEDVLLPDGSLDRHKLGSIIFHDEIARQKINSIIHPRVVAITEDRLKELQLQATAAGKMKERGKLEPKISRGAGQSVGPGQPIVAVVDAPLLFEAGMDVICDEVWVVAVNRETQIGRLMKREGYGRDEAITRIDAQMPLEKKKERATRVIDNEGTVEQTRRVVTGLFRCISHVV